MTDNSIENIKSRKNQYIKTLAGIKRDGRGSSYALIEGKKLIREAILSGIATETILSTSFDGLLDDDILLGKSIRKIIVTDEIIELLSSTKTPQGMIALIKRRTHDNVTDTEIDANGTYLLLESVGDPGNVGTIIRTAQAFGMSGVILCGGCADLYNDKTLRATMGAVFSANVMYASDAPAAIAELKRRGLAVYAAVPGEDSEDITALNISAGCAFVIGNEGLGITDEARAACDKAIKLPMTSLVESLNAAVAAGIIMWESFRRKLPDLRV